MDDELTQEMIETEDRPPSVEEKAQIAALYDEDGNRRGIPEDAQQNESPS